MSKHVSVLKKEVFDLLNIKPNGVYADVTLGGGGHSQGILESLDRGTLISFDLDKDAVTTFKNELGKAVEVEKETDEYGFTIVLKNSNKRIILVNENFANINCTLKDQGIKHVDGILGDLGWSYDQLETIDGLSYKNREAELDMRIDKALNVKAFDLLNMLGESELKRMFVDYADLGYHLSLDLSKEIKKAREIEKINTVDDLLNILDFVLSERSVSQNQVYSKVFQALRIAVNNEYTNLTELLKQGFEVLNSGGRFLIITFHSGEEKLVETFFDSLVKTKKAEYVSESKKKKYIQPTLNELRENLSSRSAKLWAIEKL